MNDQLLLEINSWAGQHQWLDNLMVFCAKYLVYLIFLAAAIWLTYIIYKRNWKPGLYFLGNLVLAFVLLQIASRLYVDHRPFVDHNLTQLLPHDAGKSFPSNHTTVAFAIALGLLAFSQFKKSAVIVLVAAALVGFARIFCGLHYPVDILGGIAVAGLSTLIMYLAYKYKTGDRHGTDSITS